MNDQSGEILQIRKVIKLDENVMDELNELREKYGTDCNKEFMDELIKMWKIKEKPICSNNEHEEYIGESWDYEGLHIIQNGDKLTIYNPDNKKKVWSGVIKFKQDGVFKHIYERQSYAYQKGIEKNVWANYFYKKYPAKLIPAKNRK